MCRTPSSQFWLLWWSASLSAAGLGIAWQMALVRSASSLWRPVTPSGASPLLRLSVKTLRLRSDAPYLRPRHVADVVPLRRA